MQLASQNNLIQSANIHLIQIRREELRYFLRFFSSFGVQCAIMASLAMQLLSQTPADSPWSDCDIFWSYLYWIASTIVFVIGMQGLLTSVFVCVYGERFALRGNVLFFYHFFLLLL